LQIIYNLLGRGLSTWIFIPVNVAPSLTRLVCVTTTTTTTNTEKGGSSSGKISSDSGHVAAKGRATSVGGRKKCVAKLDERPKEKQRAKDKMTPKSKALDRADSDDSDNDFKVPKVDKRRHQPLDERAARPQSSAAQKKKAAAAAAAAESVVRGGVPKGRADSGASTNPAGKRRRSNGGSALVEEEAAAAAEQEKEEEDKEARVGGRRRISSRGKDAELDLQEMANKSKTKKPAARALVEDEVKEIVEVVSPTEDEEEEKDKYTGMSRASLQAISKPTKNRMS
jgi:hypothetical protein